MSTKDLFNNIKNDYVCGAITSPCLNGIEDDLFFQFFDNKEVGVSSNIRTLMSIGLENIKVPITLMRNDRTVILPNQSIFILGMENGITKKKIDISQVKELTAPSEVVVSISVRGELDDPDIKMMSVVVSTMEELSIEISKFIMSEKLNVGIYYDVDKQIITLDEKDLLYVVDLSINDNDMVTSENNQSFVVSVNGGVKYKHGAFRGIAMICSPIEKNSPTIYENMEPVILFRHLDNGFDPKRPKEYVKRMIETDGFVKTSTVYLNVSDNDEQLLESMIVYNPTQYPIEINYIIVV